MKKFTILVGALLVLMTLVGCEPGYSKYTPEVMPPELSDCGFYNIINSRGGVLQVVRCPNSTTSTTYQAGKTRHTTAVIDECK